MFTKIKKLLKAVIVIATAIVAVIDIFQPKAA